MTNNPEIPKYPRTPYWPKSPSMEKGARVMTDTSRIIGHEVVITEKLDGSNVLLHQGEVYPRSTTSGPARNHPWLAMARKHHAWKTTLPELQELLLYGEDIYGVHSIEYGPVHEERTLYIFASMGTRMAFDSFRKTREKAERLEIPTVPLVHQGVFKRGEDLGKFLGEYMEQATSALGGEIEGLVIRHTHAFPASAFGQYVCKYVRPHHVQTDEHWTRNWRPCALIKEKAGNQR